MFGNLKLSSKMFGGFTLVLVLASIIAVFGYQGLTGVADRVDKGDDVNRLVKELLTTRQQEKNFIIRKDQAIPEKVKHTVEELIRQATITKEKFSQKINKDQMDQVIGQVSSYHQAFLQYVSLQKQQAQTMEQMRLAGRQALAQCELIRKDQKTQLDETRVKGNLMIQDKLDKADDANRLIKYVLDAKALRIIQEYNPSDENINKWQEINKQIFTLVNDLKKRFTKKENIAQADAILKSYQDYEANALSYFTSRSQEHKQQLIKAAQTTLKEIEGIRADQKKQLAQVKQQVEKQTADKLIKADDANRMIKWMIEARRDEKQFIIQDGDPALQAQVLKATQNISKLALDLKDRSQKQQNKEMSDKVMTAVSNYTKAFAGFVQMIEKQKTARADMLTSARKAQEICNAARADQKNKLQNETRNSQLYMGIAAISAILLGFFMAFFITRSVTGPLNKVINGLGAGASQVAAASGQVTNSSQSLAEGASEQAASLEETASSLEEMASMTKQNAENAGQADNMMKQSIGVVQQANSSMGQLKKAMEKIDKASDETAKIIKTIDEIAFQTNLLALNAAVEAARAGEAGAGFAVVADEVRSLALRAAEAAKNTQALIEDNIKDIKEGAQLVVSTDTAFSQVQESSGKVAELVGEISAASKEQAEGIEQVNKAARQMDEVTQQNAANAEESAAAAEELSAQAESMQGFVGDLTSLVGTSDRKKTKKLPLPKLTKTLKPSTKPQITSQQLPMPDPDFDEDFKDF